MIDWLVAKPCDAWENWEKWSRTYLFIYKINSKYSYTPFQSCKSKKIIYHCSSSKHIYFPIMFPFKIELLIIGTLCGWKKDMQVKCLVHIAKLHATFNLFLNIWRFIYLLRPIISLIFKMFPLSFRSKEPKSQTPPHLYL